MRQLQLVERTTAKTSEAFPCTRMGTGSPPQRLDKLDEWSYDRDGQMWMRCGQPGDAGGGSDIAIVSSTRGLFVSERRKQKGLTCVVVSGV